MGRRKIAVIAQENTVSCVNKGEMRAQKDAVWVMLVFWARGA
jgi:hypothetical protein